MNSLNFDAGFEEYRRQRERRRRAAGPSARVLSGPADALRELEEAEAREERDRQLSREVHEFFQSATQKAAGIVRKVAETAKEQADEQLSSEMEQFLLETLQRMESFVASLMFKKQGGVAEEQIEPHIRNIVGRQLDQFRSAGSDGGQRHLGMDPTATDLEDIVRGFRARLPGLPQMAAAADPEADESHTLGGAPRADIEEHLVAEMHREMQPEEQEDPRHGGSAHGEAAPAEPNPAAARANDLERFKEALKTLVRQGTMSKAEARAAWEARLATMQR